MIRPTIAGTKGPCGGLACCGFSVLMAGAGGCGRAVLVQCDGLTKRQSFVKLASSPLFGKLS